MRVVVCAKQVLDPDAVNNYALSGGLTIGADGKTLTQSAIPHLMNAYDEQAIEAALKLRDAGVDVNLAVVSLGPDPASILKHAAALGANEIVSIPVAADVELDGPAVAGLLASWIESTGGADLVLCGRQASDDDQGVVPALIAERLGAPLVNVARAVEATGDGVRVTRPTPDGDQVVETALPAVVTISNELGEPRYPTTAQTIKARRMKPTVVDAGSLGGVAAPRARVIKQFVPTIQGHCEFIEGGSPAELAEKLYGRLKAENLLG